MIRNVDRFLAETNIDLATVHLALAGGYALNCPTNSMLMNRYGFAGLLAPPCANDSGQSLGLGLALLHQLDPQLEFTLETAFVGAPWSGADQVLRRPGTLAQSTRPHRVASSFVDDVIAGPVAWISGNAESGPRALGHRSLLADPRTIESKRHLNRIKERQWWRPVAPVVLESEAGSWFETSRPSPFMLEIAPIRPERAEQVPAIAHLDGSARLQTLRRKADPLLFDAIAEFAEQTGVPILCNTSLNGPGQPIVQTLQQAIAFCASKGISVCYVEGERIEVGTSEASISPTYSFPPALSQPNIYDGGQLLTRAELYHIMTTPELHGVNIADADDRQRAREAARSYYDAHPNDLAWTLSWLSRTQPERW